MDIGGSYNGLCELVGGYYFTYEEHDPIKFNPFYIPAGETLDTEKKESLKALLVSLVETRERIRLTEVNMLPYRMHWQGIISSYLVNHQCFHVLILSMSI